MLTHPNCIIRQTIFRPLGVLPLKFLHALEIDQGLLAHTPNGNGGPPKNLRANM